MELIFLAAVALAAWLIFRRGTLRKRTVTKRFLGMRFSIRGLFGVRSWYIPLPFGYRWELWRRETEAQRRARERRKIREAIERGHRRGR